METSKEVAYIAALVLGWIATAFGVGKGVGKALQESSQVKQNLKILEEKQQKDMDDIKACIEKEFKKIHAYFHTADNADRFLTEDKHQELCGYKQEHLQRLSQQQGEIFKQLSALAVSYAQMEGKLNSGGNRVSGNQEG